ncbi:MAG: IS3 family transposase, partial [Pseudonocardiaceae bacterium]
MSSRFDKETRAKAVRLVKDRVGDYESEWAAPPLATSGRRRSWCSS